MLFYFWMKVNIHDSHINISMYNLLNVTIIFESHSTTFDNEQHLSSGWNDIALSPLGKEQAKDLGARRGQEL